MKRLAVPVTPTRTSHRRDALLAERGLHILDTVKNGPRKPQQHPPVVGEAQLSCRAVEQAHAEMLLKLRNLFGDRGLA
jgi:hypothetical protein